ncbi:MAG: TIGR01777 family oxidoreductase [Phycisphaerales bacterium]|jgi:uncharacterized protein (TIGR01777 family)
MDVSPDGDEKRGTPKRVVIAGGTGFLGSSLAAFLADRNYEPVVLGRRPERYRGVGRAVGWDGRSQGDWSAEIDGAAAVVNLAGRSVDCVKTPDHCDEILRSRVESTRAIGEAIDAAQTPPPVWVQMSTAHIYGDPPEAICDEQSAFGYGLAPTVGRAWEAAFDEACPSGVRRVVLRTSFVVGRGGGAMTRLGTLARLGLGGRVGSGKQGFSWIHEHDMNRIFQRAIEDDATSGAYIASAANPVSQAEFMRSVRRAIGMPIGLPAPAFGVRLAAPLILKTDPELAIYGRYVVPQRLIDEGFRFEFESVDAAMQDLYAKK